MRGMTCARHARGAPEYLREVQPAGPGRLWEQVIYTSHISRAIMLRASSARLSRWLDRGNLASLLAPAVLELSDAPTREFMTPELELRLTSRRAPTKTAPSSSPGLDALSRTFDGPTSRPQHP